MTPSVTQSEIQTVLGNFLTSILPSSVKIILGQANRVSEPSGQDFVVMTPIRRERIETNSDTYQDCQFTAAIAGTVLDVTAVKFGTIAVGNTVFGLDVASGTTIASNGSGSGGIGTYNLSGSSQTVTSETMAAGVQNISQPTKITYQLDVHGPNSADNAQLISTLFRDRYACTQFYESGYPISPLYCDEGRQAPFINAESQFEFRWVLEAVLQANISLVLPQQFADVLTPTLINATNEYPVN